MELQGGFSITSQGGAGQIVVQTESALRFFRKFTVANTDQYARQLGLYANVNLGRDLKGRFASLSTPKHLLSNRKNGCTWDPKGNVRLGIDEFPTCPVEYNGEQCPDIFYGTCFERLFAPGSNTPMTDSAEAQAVLRELLEQIYLGLGNSFFNLYNFANHPIIEEVNTTKKYVVDEVEWVDYYDQQMSADCGGLITQLDLLADNPIYAKYYNLQIAEGASGINLTTNDYDGDITDLLRSLEKAASPKLRIAINQGVQISGAGRRFPVILLTDPEYLALEKYYADMAPGNELAYKFMLELEDGTTQLMPNMLRWKKMPVIRWEAFTEFDAITGVKSHRAAIVAPGSWGVLGNVDQLENRLFSGAGLAVQESPLLKDKGKIYMFTTFRWGAAIADAEMCVMASNTIR